MAMAMISYAQNFEDVMLSRCFAGQRGGFYVDVGAAHPVQDSVTAHFYEQGWNGINVEPVPSLYAALVAARPRDLNLQCAVGGEDGEADFSEMTGGLSTLLEQEAERSVARGFEGRSYRVRTRTLASILAEAAPADIHFLKVDVEGAEAVVLRSNDWRRFRPHLVLVESTRPNEQTPAWQEWEPYLLEQGYVFVWFDGLNRFYVERGRANGLAAHFATPPNVFDNFSRRNDMLLGAGLATWQQRHAQLLCQYALKRGIGFELDVFAALWPRGSARKAEAADVAEAYRLILGREGDAAGMEHWAVATARGLKVVDLIRAFVASDEYQAKRNLALQQAASEPIDYSAKSCVSTSSR